MCSLSKNKTLISFISIFYFCIYLEKSCRIYVVNGNYLGILKLDDSCKRQFSLGLVFISLLCSVKIYYIYYYVFELINYKKKLGT